VRPDQLAYHGFAIHELAAAAGRDRVEYFLDVLGRPRQIDFRGEGAIDASYNFGKPLERFPVDSGRLRRVVELVAERSSWVNKKSGKGHGFGFAAYRSFLSYVAPVVEVQVDDAGRVLIPRVDLAVDAGLIVHPERVRAQFQGAAVFAAGVALMNEITAAPGPDPAVQLPRLPGAADQRGALRDARARRAEPRATGGGGRTGRAADDPGDLQRYLRRHRQAHSRAAHQEHELTQHCRSAVLLAVGGAGTASAQRPESVDTTPNWPNPERVAASWPAR
jgi:hypothetical protein